MFRQKTIAHKILHARVYADFKYSGNYDVQRQCPFETTFPVYWYCICYAVSGNQSWK